MNKAAQVLENIIKSGSIPVDSILRDLRVKLATPDATRDLSALDGIDGEEIPVGRNLVKVLTEVGGLGKSATSWDVDNIYVITEEEEF